MPTLQSRTIPLEYARRLPFPGVWPPPQVDAPLKCTHDSVTTRVSASKASLYEIKKAPDNNL
jgi:hypothetical protein